MRHCIRRNLGQWLGAVGLLLLGSTAAVAQNVVAGRVVNAETQAPLASAVVTITGARGGVLTNEAGRYSIRAMPTDSLTVRILGYATKTVAVNGRTTVDVQMTVEAVSLDEIVAVGYTQQTRKTIAGAVGSVNTAQIQSRQVTQVTDVLSSKVAGVDVRNSGQPGVAAQINIRGSAFTAGNNPLYVVDGMYMSDLRNINPSDIQSIEVLKDASAASQYGARAANGVVVITTKKGAASENNKFTLRSTYGTQSIGRLIPMQNSQQWATLYKEKYENSKAIDPTSTAVPSGALDVLSGKNTYNTDWQKAITRTGRIQDHNLSLSGGTTNGNATYFVSGGYTQQTGTLLSTNFDRVNLRVNSQLRRGIVTFGENIAIARSNRDDPAGSTGGAVLNDAVNMFPAIPVKNDGNFGPAAALYGIGTSNYPSFANNPVGQLLLNRLTQTQNQLIGSLFGKVDITQGLQYRLQLGVSYNANSQKSFSNAQMVRLNTGPFPASLSLFNVSDQQILLEHLLSLNRTFGKHAINGTAGYTQQNVKTDNLNASRTTFTYEQLQVLNAGTQQVNNGETKVESRLNSWLARVGYTYSDRYILEGNFRRDGSSRFGPLNRWGNFYSGALGWIVSGEPFFKSLPLIGGADYLKLRGSYGTQGNQDFNDYQWMSLVTSANAQGGEASICCAYMFGEGQGTLVPALGIVAQGNPRIKWQSNQMTNVGFDLGLLNNKLSITAEYYKSKSTGVLAQVPLIPSLGSLTNPYVNAASLQNSGFEFTAQHTLSKGALTVTNGLNLTTMSNKVLALGGTNQDIIVGASRTSVGHPLGSFYLMQTCGIFQNQAEITAHKVQPTARPGDLCFVDINGDGQITQDADRRFAGSPFPKLNSGLFSTGTYRSFDFTLGLRGVFGSKAYDGIMPGIMNTNGDSNSPEWLKTWHSENDGSNAPKAYWGSLGNNNARGPNDRWLENNSYLRFQNVELGYKLPLQLLGHAGLSVDRARLYVNLQDIYTYTNYLGYDPQFRANSTLQPGEDPGYYPTPRTITIGVDVGF